MLPRSPIKTAEIGSAFGSRVPANATTFTPCQPGNTPLCRFLMADVDRSRGRPEHSVCLSSCGVQKHALQEDNPDSGRNQSRKNPQWPGASAGFGDPVRSTSASNPSQKPAHNDPEECTDSAVMRARGMLKRSFEFGGKRVNSAVAGSIRLRPPSMVPTQTRLSVSSTIGRIDLLLRLFVLPGS